MQVLKFGGTSLGNAQRILGVLDIIQERCTQSRVGVVLSAVSGVTNFLLASITKALEGEDVQLNIDKFFSLHETVIRELVQEKPGFPVEKIRDDLAAICDTYRTFLRGIQLLKECPDKIYCQILSLGERVSVRLMEALLTHAGLRVHFIDACDVIKTKGSLKEGTPILEEVESRFSAVVERSFSVLLMSGFIGSDREGTLSLLGRNGSDTSASLMAVGVKAERCEIWTDVDGIYTGDPNQIPDAQLIPVMSYGEAMELAFYGAKVLHPKTTGILATHHIPLYIKNTFNPTHEGTKISSTAPNDDALIRGVSSMNNVALINIYGSGMKGLSGIAARIFGAVSRCGVSIILISQASSEYSICFCVGEADVATTEEALRSDLFLEIDAKIIEGIDILRHQSVICIMGEQMHSRYGIAGTFFSALAATCINVVAIAQGSSEKCISAVIEGQESSRALRAVHRFFFRTVQSIELYIFGVGSIGHGLLAQIKGRQSQLLEEGVEIKVCAIANSKKMIYAEDGIDLSHWQTALGVSDTPSDLGILLEKVGKAKPLNGVFVDCSSSETLAERYADVFHSGLHIVTPNKKANSGPIGYYHALRREADKKRRRFLYETNVGAGLPVIDTFKGMLKSGDKLVNFSGILSGSLSFIFGLLEEGVPFSQAVRTACDKKFTEPDPRDDLSGLDVARKVLILSREAGLQHALEDVQLTPILPNDFDSSGTIEEFLSRLPAVDSYFDEQVTTLRKNNQVLRFVGEISENQCRVNMRPVGQEHPLYPIKGGENAFAFLTQRYAPIPLVVRGYGAGVGVTAAGVFADILKTVEIN